MIQELQMGHQVTGKFMVDVFFQSVTQAFLEKENPSSHNTTVHDNLGANNFMCFSNKVPPFLS